MKVTPHFTSEEWTCRDGSVYPPEWISGRLRPLCEVLEVLRTALGERPITIVSGYRSPAHNRAIGGARASQHVEGRAADIRVAGVPAQRVHDVALRLYHDSALPIGGLGKYGRFTHIDVRPGGRLARWSGTRTTA